MQHCHLHSINKTRIEASVRAYMRYCTHYKETLLIQLQLELGVSEEVAQLCWEEVEDQLLI
jgi:hypothetical protein